MAYSLKRTEDLETLAAFIDNVLPPAQRHAVVAWLARDRDAAELMADTMRLLD